MQTNTFAPSALAAAIGLFQIAFADFQILSDVANSTLVPLTSACLTALQSTVQCDQSLETVSGSDYYFGIDNGTQSSLCTDACEESLSSYHESVSNACAGQDQPWDGYPANYFGDLLWATYNYSCLADPKTGSSCMTYFSNLSSTYTNDITYEDMDDADLCSGCTLSLWRLLQRTEFSFYDDDMASQWAAIQARCGVSYPTAVQPKTADPTNIPGYAPANYSTAPCLSGSTYTVASGDNCVAISQSQKVSTGTLVVLNNLLPDCSNLYAGSSLCLPQACEVYSVQSGDTCAGITNSSGISFVEFRAWNPSINPYCTNLLADNNVCVGQPGAQYTGTTIAGASVTQTAVYASATVSPPSNVAHGTTKSCGKYYTVQSGDDCSLIALNQTITISLFESINPSVNQDCTNLVPGLAYCVSPTSDWNSTAPSNATITSTYVSAPAPTVSGTPNTCYEWHTVVSGDYCGLLESEYDITFAELQLWNPSLDDACSNLILGDAYCVEGGSGASATAAVVEASTTSA